MGASPLVGSLQQTMSPSCLLIEDLITSSPGVVMLHVGAWVLVLYTIHRFTLDRRDGAGRSKIPTVRGWPVIIPDIVNKLSFNWQAPRLIREGYTKYKDQPFRILKLGKPLVVIPFKYADELRSVSNQKLSQREAFEAFGASFRGRTGSYTGVYSGSDMYNDVIHRRLTPNIPRMIPEVIDELHHAFNQDLPPCDGTWARVQPHKMFLGLVSRTGSRVFVSRPICRDPEFLETTVSLTTNAFTIAAIMDYVPSVLQPLVSSRLRVVKQLRAQLDYINDILGSEVERRRRTAAAAAAAATTTMTTTTEKGPDHNDFLEWASERAVLPEDQDSESLARLTTAILSMAVVHTSAMAATHLIYDLVERPDVLERLIEEQETLLPGGWSEITQEIMQDMRLLDSVLKESQRFNPVSEVAFNRLVKERIVLSDGFVLEPGQQIGIAGKLINQEPEAMKTYDAFRWVSDPSPTAAWTYSGTHNLSFGFGRYACPGRFFAIYQLKAILSRFLLEYDFQLEDGSTVRPRNVAFGDKIAADYSKHLLIKKRVARS
ncbi:cytochrome P450 monooxygenase [Geosmithia morbida]|uniref:Cytochrome P450 monooxygenase n=1 Tax=Geosmithia morbida TaxID=1094350 RepID=A0A9P4YVR2_9HYPO|nr:cytochrome P450 monooxygenase [Geosmithia morbida]KAF4122578.1 cytochrome P450 monooxygenase [Geosmithia morbida]